LVLLVNLVKQDKNRTHPPTPIAMMLAAPLGGICEEDEEEAEEEEAAEEAAIEQEKQQRQTEAEAAEAEWGDIEEFRIEQAKAAPAPEARGVAAACARAAFKAIPYREAVTHFRNAEYCIAHTDGTYDIRFVDKVELGVLPERVKRASASDNENDNGTDGSPGAGSGSGSGAGGSTLLFETGANVQAKRRGSSVWEPATVSQVRRIEPHAPRSKRAGIFSCMFVPPRVSYPKGTGERDLIFCIAKCALDDDEPVHIRMLQTVNKKLLSYDMKSKDAPRFGKHWEDIGFQGSDPATDLRGVGMLVVLQMLAFVYAHHTLTVDIQRYSENGNKYPVMALSTNFPEVCLCVLRDGRLHGEINKRKDVAGVINELFFAQWFDFYERVRSDGGVCGPKWIQHKEDVKNECKKSPLAMLQRFREFGKEKQFTEQAHFTNIDDKNLGKSNAAGAGAGAGTDGGGAGPMPSRYAAK
jgi:hypothetical protein